LKTILFGIGKYLEENINKLPEELEIIGYADNSHAKITSISGKEFKGKIVYSLSELEKIDFDLIYICTGYLLSSQIYEQIKSSNIDCAKVRFLNRINSIDGKWEYEVKKDGTIVSHINGISFIEKNQTDSDILAEIYAEHTYSVNVLPDSVVFDLGMNVGIASLYFASNENVSKVFGFEPFSDTYKMACDNFAINPGLNNKIEAFNWAIMDKEENRDVPVTTDMPGWRSVLSDSQDYPCENITIRDASKVIGELIEKYPTANYVLKCDTEGSEFSIFKSLGESGIIDRFNTIILEYHNKPNSILEVLTASKFRYYRYGSRTFGIIVAFK